MFVKYTFNMNGIVNHIGKSYTQHTILKAATNFFWGVRCFTQYLASVYMKLQNTILLKWRTVMKSLLKQELIISIVRLISSLNYSIQIEKNINDLAKHKCANYKLFFKFLHFHWSYTFRQKSLVHLLIKFNYCHYTLLNQISLSLPYDPSFFLNFIHSFLYLTD